MTTGNELVTATNIVALYKTGRRNFAGADLKRANLSHAKLLEADLEGANLLHARLSGALISYAAQYLKVA